MDLLAEAQPAQMIYHCLTEKEPFSESRGGAISRWTANVASNEPETHVVCSEADESWGFAEERIHLVPRIQKYLRFRGRRFYPPQIGGAILRHLYGDAVPSFHKGDTVWVHGEPVIAAALGPLVQKAGAKMVFHLHGAAFATHSSLLVRKAAELAEILVFCSKYLERQAKERFPDLKRRTAVLYNGADPQMFFPVTRPRPQGQAPIILYVGRLIPQKGPHIFTAAMRLLERRGTHVRGQICGASGFGGSEPTKYVTDLQRNAPSNVEFCGYETGHELANRFRSSDIFCCPSVYQEPLGMVVAEAMASKLPVVATNVGGIPEWFIQGGGVLIPPANPAALADRLEMLVMHLEERTRIAQEGYTSFQRNFSWANTRRAYLEVIGSL